MQQFIVPETGSAWKAHKIHAVHNATLQKKDKKSNEMLINERQTGHKIWILNCLKLNSVLQKCMKNTVTSPL